MKPEQSERLFVETLVNRSIERKKIAPCKILEIEKLTGDASTRRYYRVEAETISYVVCLDNPVSSLKEYPFYEVYAAFEKADVRVPKIYDIDVEKGYLLEEDLGDVTFLKKLGTITDPKEEFDLYKNTLDILIHMHKIDPRKYEGACFTSQSFDFQKLMYEVEFTYKYFFNILLETTPTESESKILQDAFTKICTILGESKKVVTHRDFHSRNLMYINQTQVVIDFQDARLGIPQYDLVSLLEDCYYEHTLDNKVRLKTYYYENFIVGSEFDQGREQFNYVYDLMTVQRVFKAIGSFAYIHEWRKDIRYLKYIGYAFEKIRNVLLKYPEFSDLRVTLSRIYYDS